jgi:hypothetical protein
MNRSVEKHLKPASTETSSIAAGIDRNHSVKRSTDRSSRRISSRNRTANSALGVSLIQAKSLLVQVLEFLSS